MAFQTSHIFPALVPALFALALVSTSGCGGGQNTSAGGSGGSGGSTSTGTSGGTGGGGGAPPKETKGCSADVKLYVTPEGSAEPGPWPVGAKTFKVDYLTVEAWYPAKLGSDKGQPQVTYDLREWLPDSEKGKIPDVDAPTQTCGCYRDLPFDDAHGPYPVLVFLHGTAGFRTQSLAQMQHWASRGFVVVAADYPGLYLGDALDFNFTNDLPGDTKKIVDALGAPGGDIAFLQGHIDLTHLGMAGHSAGGIALKGMGSLQGVRVLAPLAAGGVDPSPTLESTLLMGGLLDKVVSYDKQVQGYADSGPTKRLIGIKNTGHLFPTELCWITNKQGQSILETAQKYNIKNANLAGNLFDCPEGQLANEVTRAIVNFATTAAFEEKLVCKGGNPFMGLQQVYPDISEIKEELK